MTFWNLNHALDQIAIVDSTLGVCTYGDLINRVSVRKEQLPKGEKKQLGLILTKNNLETITNYIAGLQNGDALMLLDENLKSELLHNIIKQYEPDWLAVSTSSFIHKDYELYYHENEYGIWKRKISSNKEISSDLAILLSTSGTTGSSKFVRLSYKNIQANAESISQYLDLSQSERAITTLPMHYSYGLSVVNSHLYAGGTLLLTDESLLSRGFWDFFNKQEATSFSGVPYHYQMLQRLRFENMELPSLRYLTQAGGRLGPKLVEHFHKIAKEKNYQFFVMYGQTEATARISYMPPEQLTGKYESIGIPIPGGKLSIEDDTNELIYEGPNVMLGYAESRDDLAKGDGMNGVLHTGDIAEVDEDGFYYIKGRMKRFIKLFGLRVNLDEIEKRVEGIFSTSVACTGTDDKLSIFIENEQLIDDIKSTIRETYKLHPSSFKVKFISSIPRFENGKVNYTKLKDL